MRKYTKRKPLRLCDVKTVTTKASRPLIAANDDIAIAAAKLLASGWLDRSAGGRREHEDEAPAAFTYTGYVPAKPKAIKPKAERSVLVVRRNREGRERTERIDVKAR